MASIKKLDGGSWRARYRDDAGKEHAKHFARKIDGQRWLDQVTAAVQTGTYADPKSGRATVGEWSAQWLTAQSHLKPSTYVRYESLLRCQVFPRWEAVPLSRVGHAEVAAWVADLSASGLAGSTIRQAHRVLSLMLALALRDGRLGRNPADGVKLPRAAKPEKRFLTHTEVADLADACGDYGLVIRVLASCGLRFGELAALRVSHLDLMRRRIEVTASVSELNGVTVFGTPKSHQCRSVPVPRSVVDDLAIQVAGKTGDDLVFTTLSGTVLRLMNFRRRVFDPAATSVGLAGLTPHELRHTAASLAVAAGANVKAVQRMLGHASAAMTLDVYAGLFGDDLDAVAERMDEARSQILADSVRTQGRVVPITKSESGL